MRNDETVLRITAQYVAAVQAGRRPRLGDYLARYPEHADAIADFVAYYHAIEEAPLLNASPVFPTNSSASLLLTTLLRTVHNQSLTLAQLAALLDISPAIAALLELRAIEPTTIPRQLFVRTASALHYPIHIVIAYLFSTAQPPTGELALTKPSRPLKVAEGRATYAQGRSSFRAALETDLQLSVDQQARWHAILAEEEL